MAGYIFVTVGSVSNFREVPFSYQNKILRRKLSALAVADIECLHSVLFAPHTLSEGDIKAITEISKSQKCTILRSPSFGIYEFHYEIRFQPLVFYYLYHFLQFYDLPIEQELQSNKFFVDVSVGLNQLTFAMLEAFRFLRIFSELLNLGISQKKKPKFYMIYSEPVLGRNVEEWHNYRVYRENFKPKAFLSLPISWKDRKDLFISIENLHLAEEVKIKFKNIVENAILTISAVIKNIPLAIYLLGYDSPKYILNFINSFIEGLKPIMGNEIEPPAFEIGTKERKLEYLYSKPNINFRLINNSILLLGFYFGISKLLERYGVPNEGNKDVPIRELLKKFSEIYRLIYKEDNPSEVLLKKDVNYLDDLTKGRMPINGWIGGEKIDKEHGRKSAELRHFIAHSGLLTNLLEFNVQNGRIRYKPERKDKIKQLLCSLS